VIIRVLGEVSGGVGADSPPRAGSGDLRSGVHYVDPRHLVRLGKWETKRGRQGGLARQWFLRGVGAQRRQVGQRGGADRLRRGPGGGGGRGVAGGLGRGVEADLERLALRAEPRLPACVPRGIGSW
jgi:hypothetical protein